MADEGIAVQVMREPTAWGIAVVSVFIAYLFFRDIRNPEKAASTSVLTGLTATTSDVFEIATKALAQASAAADSASEARAAQQRCENQVTLLVLHNRQLTIQLTVAGIVPVDPPPGLASANFFHRDNSPNSPPEVG